MLSDKMDSAPRKTASLSTSLRVLEPGLDINKKA